jgi:zinc protease
MAALSRSHAFAVVAAAAFTALRPADLGAQTATAERELTAVLDEPLPLDPSVRAGRLGNGLRYLIRENREPRSRAMLRFVVEAGSILEDEDQLGLAHVLEHMAFNGTENFEKQEIVSFMESIGMRLGPGVNASTSFDATTYMLTIPTDEPENLATAFRIMEDWAHGLALEPSEIEQERRVVIEEWRGGQGAESRVGDRHYPVLFFGSRYAERLPIGTRESLETFEREALHRFYRDWYRPDLMGIVAVGDFDAAEVEALIRAHFAGIAMPDEPRERIVPTLPAHDETLYSIVADPEVPTASVRVYHKVESHAVHTAADFRDRLVESLYNRMLQMRLGEIARQPDPPFRSAVSSHGRIVRSTAAYLLGAQVPEDGIARGLEALMRESERVARYGFTSTELERAKAQMLREVERQLMNRASRSSGSYAAEYVNALLSETAIPGIELEHALLVQVLPSISLDEVESAGRNWLGSGSRVVLVTAPEKAELSLPSEELLAAVIDAVALAELEPYDDVGAYTELLTELPHAGEIVSAVEKPGGVTEWLLSNGVRVVLKPTDFDEDDVRFYAFSPGGISLVGEDDLVPARTAAAVIGAAGVGDLDATGLQKALTGKLARVDPHISEAEEGLSGQASMKDIETMFQLVYLRFTAPRADADLFEAFKAQQHQQLVNRDRNPAVVFRDEFSRLINSDHPRRQPLTVERLLEADLERSFEFYAQRFADASDFTFVFVGSFDVAALRPLVERYLGALPSSGRSESPRDHAVRFPSGVVESTVRVGREPRAETRIAFAPRDDLSFRHESTLMTAVTHVLERRLRDVLREELGGTYGVGVGIMSFLEHTITYVPTITFGADPERMEELSATVFEEIAALRAEGPADSRVADVRTAMLRSHETQLEQNSAWLSALVRSYQHDDEPGADAFLRQREEIQALTPEAVRDGARRYLDPEHYVRVTLMPQAGE